MKKFISISTIFLLFLLTACNEDNSLNTVVQAGDLNGTWIITNIQRAGNSCPNPIDADLTDNCADFNGMVFCSEGKMIFDNGLYTFTFNTYENGVLVEDLSLIGESTYQIDGNTVTACDVDDPSTCQTFTIQLAISENTLTSVVDNDGFGCKQTIVAKRQ